MNINLELSYHQMKEEQKLIDFEQFQKRNSLLSQPGESKYLVGAFICIGTALVLAGWATGAIIAIFQK